MSLFWRELGHVAVWFIVAETWQYFCLLFFPELLGVLAILFAVASLAAVTVWAEWKEDGEAQPRHKTLWDIAAKISGVILAVIFPGVWEHF